MPSSIEVRRVIARQPTSPPTTLPGGKTRIVEADGETSWSFPESSRDGQMLANGNILIALSKSDKRPHGAAVEVTTDGKIVWEFSGTQSEVNTAQRLPNGNTMICSYAIGDGGTKLVEVTHEKKVVWTFVEKDGPGIHEVQVLATDGKPLTERPMR